VCSDCLVLREDASALGVLDLHKYFHNCTEFIGIDIVIFSKIISATESSQVLVFDYLILFMGR
jgi:hypothetical protein